MLSYFSFIASSFLFSVPSRLQGTLPLYVPGCPLKTMTVQAAASGSAHFKPFPHGRCDLCFGVSVLGVGFCAEAGLGCALAGLPPTLLFTVPEALPHSVLGSCNDSRHLSH